MPVKKTKKEKCNICEKMKCKCKEEFNKDLRGLIGMWLR